MHRLAGLIFTLALAGAGVPAGADAETFSDPEPVYALAASSENQVSKADLYPSSIAVSGLSGTVAKVRVVFPDLSMGEPFLGDFLLVGPSGRQAIVLSDAGGSYYFNNGELIFDDDAPGPAPESTQMVPASKGFGYFKPTNYANDVPGLTPDRWPDAPGAGLDAPASFAGFKGTDPNGTWSLYLVSEYGFGNPWSIRLDAGWELELAIDPPAVVQPPAVAQSPPAVQPPAPPPDVVAPSLDRLSIDPANFRPRSSGGPIGTGGATVGFRLSEAADVEFEVDRLLPGVRRGGRCVPPPAGARRSAGSRRCTRPNAVPGAFDFDGKSGFNTFHFTGRMNGRSLRQGAYRLLARATDAAGNTSGPATVGFRMKRQPSKQRP